jgi:N-methylhydantoinase B
MDDDGVEMDKGVYFAVTITKKGDDITFDFSNSQAQAKGPINLRPVDGRSVRVLFDDRLSGPRHQFNDGMRDVVKFVYAPRTITNAESPAPVSSYQKANLRLTDVILEALATFNPARAIAGSGSSGSLSINWHQGGKPGHNTLQYEILGSAYGGGQGNDGCNATATHLSNLHVTPIEIIESEYPCRITESTWSRIRAAPANSAAALPSGGATRSHGLHRGTSLRPLQVPTAWRKGRPAGGGSKFDPGQVPMKKNSTPAAGKFELKAGHAFYLESAGGGGFGDPAERNRERLARDIDEGYVSDEAAREKYGI